MSHPVTTKRNEKIKQEFKNLYNQKYLEGELYVEEIIEILSKNHNLSVGTVHRIIYSK